MSSTANVLPAPGEPKHMVSASFSSIPLINQAGGFISMSDTWVNMGVGKRAPFNPSLTASSPSSTNTSFQSYPCFFGVAYGLPLAFAALIPASSLSAATTSSTLGKASCMASQTFGRLPLDNANIVFVFVAA